MNCNIQESWKCNQMLPQPYISMQRDSYYKVRRGWYSLVFIIGIPVVVTWHYTEMVPGDFVENKLKHWLGAWYKCNWKLKCLPDIRWMWYEKEKTNACQSNVHITENVYQCHKWLYFQFNFLWPSDTIWQQTSGSTLAQVMAWCLTAPSHYLNQCWLIISEVKWNSYIPSW